MAITSTNPGGAIPPDYRKQRLTLSALEIGEVISGEFTAASIPGTNFSYTIASTDVTTATAALKAAIEAHVTEEVASGSAWVDVTVGTASTYIDVFSLDADGELLFTSTPPGGGGGSPVVTKLWTGNSVAVAQITTLVAQNVLTGDTFSVKINGKVISVVATADTAANVATLLAAAINASNIAEWREVIATVSGDTVTLTNAAGTQSIVKFWAGSGTGWRPPGTVIPGDLLVGGTISGEVNISITGSAVFEGFNTLTYFDPVAGGSVTRDVALVANTSYNADVGVLAMSNAGNIGAIYGYNGHATGYGVEGFGTATGVYGQGNIGVLGVSNSTSGVGVGAFSGTGVTSYAMVAQAFGSGNAFKAIGKSTFDSQIASTLAPGTAPFNVASTTVCPNLNVSQLLGKTWAAPDPLGATTPNTVRCTSLRIDQGSSSGSAQWNLPNGGNTASGKPGANSTGVFVPVNMNGVSGWMLWWAN